MREGKKKKETREGKRKIGRKKIYTGGMGGEKRKRRGEMKTKPSQ